MKASKIRQKFIQFFEEKKHKIVPSAPIVVKNDPTLMFTNAGMNQFKDYFLGTKNPEYTRAVDTQKCLRVSGKHNDLEEVGVDTYHHTMFEMLGNWSFGDYFKQEAIEWAWELLIDVYTLPVDRLYVTVFEGDKSDGLKEDSEAYNFWKNIVAEEKIIKCDKKDNFWEMGEQGPCGPSSEIHIDLRSQAEIDKLPGRDLVNEDHPQVIEIWNLVFIEYERKANGSLVDLPAKHIDTGMGFERLVRAIQQKQSNYDTDVFMPSIKFVEQKSGLTYGKDEKTDIAIRVIVDHVRAITFAVADGQLPSNTGAGYVIRRILRRAVRYAYTFLNLDEAFIYELVELLSTDFGTVFPEVKAQKDFIANVVKEEENSFLRTLKQGITRLESIQENLGKGQVIEGKVVFELYDTFGFPVDLTGLIARENGYSIDEKGFEVEMEKQKTRSRKESTSTSGDWVILQELEDVNFVGYDNNTSSAKIVRYRKVSEKKNITYQVVLDITPFYPESGGQIGDIGYIEAVGEKYSVIDTKKENDLIIHVLKKLPKDVSITFNCVINAEKRKLSENNHSATHLLQAALKQVLGEHITQKGSYVNDKLLRFDFSHFSKVTKEELVQVEQIVNQKIRENITLDEKRDVPVAVAKEMGATALFGEKYGESVRVITFDENYSMELCGGTHVNSTAIIGSFKIISEGSVAAGVRRVEAVTASVADEFVNDKLAELENLNDLLKQPKDIQKAVQSLITERSELLKKVEQFRTDTEKRLVKTLKQKVKIENGLSIVIEKVSLDSADSLKQVAFELRKTVDNLVMILAGDINGKPQVAVMISDNIVADKGFNAGQMIRELAKEIKGGGGGQPFFAIAGGKDITGLSKVLVKAKELLSV